MDGSWMEIMQQKLLPNQKGVTHHRANAGEDSATTYRLNFILKSNKMRYLLATYNLLLVFTVAME